MWASRNTDDVVPNLVRVGDALGEGKITHDEAQHQLAHVLANPVLAGSSDAERQCISDAYFCQFQVPEVEPKRSESGRVNPQHGGPPVAMAFDGKNPLAGA